MAKTKGTFMGHAECAACGSEDNVAVYDTGPLTCMGCGAKHPNPYENPSEDTEFKLVEKKQSAFVDVSAVDGYSTRGFKERGIPKDVCDFFQVRAGVDSSNNVIEHYYPYGVDNITGYKVRSLPKDFRAAGTLEGLFGQRNFNGGKRLVVTEGELDAMAVAYASMKKYGKIYPVVSLPSASGTKALLEQRDWVRQFDEVVLMLDNDDAGKAALDKACSIVGIDKAKIAKLKEKDANDELLKHGTDAIMSAIWDAQPWSPSGILQGDTLWDKFLDREATESIPYPACMEGVNNLTKGMRYGEVDLFTSGTGSGKSTMIKEIVLHLNETTEDKIGMISLEEGPGDTVEKFIGMQLKQNLTDVGAEISQEKKREAFEAVFSSNRIILLDHQGSVADGSLMDKIETMCLMGCKYLILDHLTIATSEVEGDANSAVDKVMSDLLKIAKKHNVWLGVISHLRKTSGGGAAFEEGKIPSLDDIKGSGSIKQISFQVIAFARNLISNDEREKNTIKIRVLKSRFTGRTGDAGGAFYDNETGRLQYVEETGFKDITEV